LSDREVVEALLAAEPSATQLRVDRDGRTWLSEHVYARCRTDPECRHVLAQFVEQERSLYDAARLPSDPFFTARVLRALPEVPSGVALSPGRRLAILACFHMLAGLAGYVAVWSSAPERVLAWLEGAAWLADTGAELGGVWMLMAAVLLGTFAIVLPKPHTPLA